MNIRRQRILMQLSKTYYNSLQDFIESHPTSFQKELKKGPYNLKSVKQCPWNEKWWLFMYNLFDSDLRNPVVRASRGSCLEIENGKTKVICAPFTKFANYGEDVNDPIDWKNAQAQLKNDGIIVKAFKVAGTVYFITNGSWTMDAPIADAMKNCEVSEEATKNARTYFDLLKVAFSRYEGWEVSEREDKAVIGTGSNWKKLPEGYTLMYELVSPQNRILCKYAETGVFFIGIRDDEGLEHFPEEVRNTFNPPLPGNKVEVIPFNGEEDAVKKLTEGWDGNYKEGVVICDKNFNRCKVKCDSYLTLKFIRGEDNLSKRGILISILEGSYDDIIGSFPEKKNEVLETLSEYKEIEKTLLSMMERYREDFQSCENRKDYALKHSQDTDITKKLVFGIFKNDDIGIVKEIISNIINGSNVTERWDALLSLKKVV